MIEETEEIIIATDPSICEAAAIMGVSETTVRRLVKKGHLRVYTMTSNGCHRITLQSIHEHIMLRKNKRPCQP